jgi:hypothetical protein
MGSSEDKKEKRPLGDDTPRKPLREAINDQYLQGKQEGKSDASH